MKNFSEIILDDVFFFDDGKAIFNRKVTKKIETETKTTILGEEPVITNNTLFILNDGQSIKGDVFYESKDELMISKIAGDYEITTVVEGEEYNLKRIKKDITIDT